MKIAEDEIDEEAVVPAIIEELGHGIIEEVETESILATYTCSSSTELPGPQTAADNSVTGNVLEKTINN